MQIGNFDYKLRDGEDEYTPPHFTFSMESFAFSKVAAVREIYHQGLKTITGEEVFIDLLGLNGRSLNPKEIKEAVLLFNEDLKRNWLEILEESANGIVSIAQEDLKYANERLEAGQLQQKAIKKLKSELS